MSRVASLSLLGCVLLCSAGCSSLALGPDRIRPVDQEAAALLQYDPTAPVPGPNTTELRNFVTERIYEIDLEYSVYFARLTTDYQKGTIAGDYAILGLTAGSTLAPAVVTKTILSATTTAVAGAKTEFDKDVLLANTIQILQNTMETTRGQIKNSIIANLSTSKYTFWQALSDLEGYYRAGTVPGALEALQAATGSNAQNQKTCANGVTPDGTGVNCSPSGTPTPPAGGAAAHFLGAAPVRAVGGGGGVNALGARVPSLR